MVAIFGFNPELFAAFVAKVLGRDVSATDFKGLETVGKDSRVQKAVMRELKSVGKKAKFNSYENVKGVRLLFEPFTIDNGLLTPT